MLFVLAQFHIGRSKGKKILQGEEEGNESCWILLSTWHGQRCPCSEICRRPTPEESEMLSSACVPAALQVTAMLLFKHKHFLYLKRNKKLGGDTKA